MQVVHLEIHYSPLLLHFGYVIRNPGDLIKKERYRQKLDLSEIRTHVSKGHYLIR